jgi:hypothetical protein
MRRTAMARVWHAAMTGGGYRVDPGVPQSPRAARSAGYTRWNPGCSSA